MVVRTLWMLVGWLSLVLGVIGIFLPVWPTTPFLLLAAFCFSRGSPRIHNWLLHHRWFGQYIRYYTEDGGIPLKVKYKVIGLLWLTMGISVIFFVPWWWLQLAMLVIAAGVSVYIWTRPTAMEID